MGLILGQVMNASKYTSAVNFPKIEVSLKDKNYIVSGGSSGIGAAVVKFLHSHGANVYILCRDITRGEKTISSLNSASKGSKTHGKLF